jgi:hypothetical protein
MRALMILSGVLLWLNAFACRQELWDAYASACRQFDYAMHSGSISLLAQGVIAAIFTLVAASPTWKLFAGGLFLKCSLETDAGRSPVPSGKTA